MWIVDDTVYSNPIVKEVADNKIKAGPYAPTGMVTYTARKNSKWTYVFAASTREEVVKAYNKRFEHAITKLEEEIASFKAKMVK